MAGLKYFGFKDQIARSGLSVPSNIAETFGRSSDKEKHNFLNYARWICAEMRTQAYIGKMWIDDPREISAIVIRRKTYYFLEDLEVLHFEN